MYVTKPSLDREFRCLTSACPDTCCAGWEIPVDEESAERLKLRRKIIRDGYAFFEIEKFDFSRERVSGIIDGFVTGFLMLAENYPDHVRME